jgi:hypothetical protein
MPTVKNVGEPCAREPHARFEVAAGGNQTSRASTCRAVGRLSPTLPIPIRCPQRPQTARPCSSAVPPRQTDRSRHERHLVDAARQQHVAGTQRLAAFPARHDHLSQEQAVEGSARRNDRNQLARPTLQPTQCRRSTSEARATARSASSSPTAKSGSWSSRLTSWWRPPPRRISFAEGSTERVLRRDALARVIHI